MKIGKIWKQSLLNEKFTWYHWFHDCACLATLVCLLEHSLNPAWDINHVLIIPFHRCLENCCLKVQSNIEVSSPHYLRHSKQQWLILWQSTSTYECDLQSFLFHCNTVWIRFRQPFSGLWVDTGCVVLQVVGFWSRFS